MKINTGYQYSELGLLSTVDTVLHMKYANLWISLGLIEHSVSIGILVILKACL